MEVQTEAMISPVGAETGIIPEVRMGKWAEVKWEQNTWIRLQSGLERTTRLKASNKAGIVASDVSPVVEGAMLLPVRKFMHNARI